jgi:hypothetical protein
VTFASCLDKTVFWRATYNKQFVFTTEEQDRLHYCHCYKIGRSIVPNVFCTSLTILMKSFWLSIDNLMQKCELAGCIVTMSWLKYIVLAPKNLCIYMGPFEA